MERPILFLLVLVVVNSLAEEAPPSKSSSKVSDFKAKLVKTGLPAKPYLSEDDDKDGISIADLGISVPPEYANDTVKRDHHIYYNSTFYADPADARKFWLNLDEFAESHVVVLEKLSDSYRQAATVELSFDFPFYGSILRNVTIATGGFLYMGDYLHNWIAATQYVAPLMANFDTRTSKESIIKYADNGTAFIVQWEKVYIQNRESDGAFTFQATLLASGDVIFAYKDIPYPVTSISDSLHPVKIGLSDAYILERAIFFVRRKTVYEYNRIHVTNYGISNNTALYFTALPTCNTFKDCPTCLSPGLNLECSWCEAVQRCSDGVDRQRQSWMEHGCVLERSSTCPSVGTSTGKTEVHIHPTETSVPSKDSTSKVEPSTYNVDSYSNDIDGNGAVAHLVHEESSGSKSNVNAGAIATILAFLVAVVAVSVWIYYAYKNPQTPSGQFLIKYRPSQWALKKENNIAASNTRHL